MHFAFEQCISCPHCEGDASGHNHGCPITICERLSGLIYHYLCPKCGKHEVDINDNDFFECRSCHAQYTTAAQFAENEELKRVAIISHGKVFMALVLPQQGQGRFPKDLALIEAQEALQVAIESLKDSDE